MPIEITDTFRQAGRSGAVSSSSYFPIIEAQDVNFAVEGIAYNNTTPTLSVGTKYILGPNSIISVAGGSENDIVRYTGLDWELFLDVSNTETNYGIVFNRTSQKFLQYDPQKGVWNPVLVSGSIDGGTFT